MKAVLGENKWCRGLQSVRLASEQSPPPIRQRHLDGSAKGLGICIDDRSTSIEKEGSSLHCFQASLNFLAMHRDGMSPAKRVKLVEILFLHGNCLDWLGIIVEIFHFSEQFLSRASILTIEMFSKTIRFARKKQGWILTIERRRESIVTRWRRNKV